MTRLHKKNLNMQILIINFGSFVVFILLYFNNLSMYIFAQKVPGSYILDINYVSICIVPSVCFVGFISPAP